MSAIPAGIASALSVDASPRGKRSFQAQVPIYQLMQGYELAAEPSKGRGRFFATLTGGSTPFSGILKAVALDPTHEEFSSLFSTLKALRKLETDWNGYGADPPNDLAVHWARSILVVLLEWNFAPDRVVASAEGGVGIYLKHGTRYAVVECLNDGSITAIGSDRRGNMRTWMILPDPRELNPALNEIRVYLNA